MFRSHDAHKRVMKKAEFELAPPEMWLETGFKADHLGIIGLKIRLGELPRDLGLGGKNLFKLVTPRAAVAQEGHAG